MSRGFTKETIHSFNITDIEDPIKLLNSARDKWGLDRLIKCGLWIKRGNIPKSIWWQHVILFPFYNIDGKINYIQGRFLDHKKFRYMNLSGINNL